MEPKEGKKPPQIGIWKPATMRSNDATGGSAILNVGPAQRQVPTVVLAISEETFGS